MREFEIKSIRTALIKTRGNQRRAAILLGVKVTTLHNKIKTCGIRAIKLPAGKRAVIFETNRLREKVSRKKKSAGEEIRRLQARGTFDLTGTK